MPSKAAKTPTKKTAGKTSKSAVKAAPKRTTVATLAQNLKSLESRLKGADTKNRNALKALQSVVEDIKTTANQSTTTQKAALTRGLNQIEIRMETYLDRAVSEARAGVRSELANVTAAGSDLSTLEHALQAAHGRLDDLDAAQRESLGRLNRHIADLATSVERRLIGETKAREAASAALEAKIDAVRNGIETRVDQVEQDTADALQAVGAKISEFADILEDRAKMSDVDTAERLADLAQETQSEFNSVQTDVTTRLEALEMIASNWSPSDQHALIAANPYLPANADDPRIDQMGEMIQALQDELSRMHARMASIQDPAIVAPNNVVPMPAPMNVAQDNPYAAAVRALEVNASETALPQVAVEAATPVQTTPAADSHIPQEFDPTAFSAPPIASPAFTPPPAPIPAPAPLTAPSSPAQAAPPAMPIPPLAPPMASTGSFAPAPDAVQGNEPLMPAPLPVSTYDDPAYAEGDEMRAERIGGQTSKRPSLPISGRNLRVAALAVGVGVVGLLAAKMVLGGPEATSTEARNEVPTFAPTQERIQNAELNLPNQIEDQPLVATPPLGEYAETQTPTLAAGAQDTLDAAVQAGNPIAQFQKGLVQLQAGQMEEGARLIRLAANRNQPAAQYRLAKLYESGTGIAKDPITARELIERAARGGNRIAMHDLGNYHAYGQGGLDRDMGEALDWFTKAADRGVVDSQFNVAFLREGNEGVPADIETALFWYFVAARQGDQGAPDRIAILSEQLDASTIAGIQSRADRFNPKPVDEAANGVFRNVPWSKTARSASPAQSAQIIKIREAQTLLSELGYQVGSPDGIAGAKTRDAVKSFEAVNGLPQTGQVTDELLRKLEMASGA
ncbi:MAG: peptidoglycan-binding protein [Litorimonas sp.]